MSKYLFGKETKVINKEEIKRYKKHSKIYKNLYTKHYINVTIF